jgi:hypothetical protein
MHILYNYLQTYLNRPTVVIVDMILLFTLLIMFVGVLVLKRKIDSLNIAIELLKNKINNIV